MTIELAIMYIFSVGIACFILGFVLGKYTDKQSKYTVKIVSILFLIFFSGLASFLLLRSSDVPIFLQMILLGLSAEVLGINLSEAFGFTERIQKLKKTLLTKDNNDK